MKSFTYCLAILFLISSAAFGEEPSAPLNVPLRISVSPNLWFIHPVIVHALGWDKEQGIPLEIVRFSGPATQMQGFAAGQVDIVNNNAGSILLTNEKGIPIRYIGALLHGDVNLVAALPLMELRATLPAVEALRAFRQKYGRPVRLAANPRGSMSDLSLRVWLERNMPVTEGLVEVTNTGDQAQLQQLFITESVDAAALFEPLTTLAISKMEGAGVFLSPEELLKEQNGGFIAVAEDILKTRRADLVTLIRLYERADKFIKEHPEESAKIVDEQLTLGLIPRDVLAAALKKIGPRYTIDPNPFVPEVQLLADWLYKSGDLKTQRSVRELFDTSIYEESLK